VTILERCDLAHERDANPVHFVKIKRKLAELISWDIHLDGLRRWVGLEKLVQRITAVTKASNDISSPFTVEDDDFRIRTVKQGALRAEVNRRCKTVM
jgi:hypothetical protein